MNQQILLENIHLVVDKLMNLGHADYDADKSTSREDTQKGLIARDFGIEEWDWPQGVGLYGLLKLQNYYEDDRYMEFFQKWFDRNVELGLPSSNINTTAPYLVLSEILDGLEASDTYRQLCLERADWLMNDLPKTLEGGFQHVTSAIGDRNGITLNDGQLWVDTLVMTVLFLNRMGYLENREAWKQEALHQFLVHIKYLFDKRSGLFYHGWSFIRQDNFGGIFWCRGNSWFTFGVMDYLETCGDRLEGGVRSFLLDTFRAQVDTLVACQSSSGLWHTVLDDPTSYEEVSGSCAIAAGILKGIRTGILSGKRYEDAARRAIHAICSYIAEDGTVLQVSAGTGIGTDADHYKNILCMPMAYGQSLALLALCEALQSPGILQ